LRPRNQRSAARRAGANGSLVCTIRPRSSCVNRTSACRLISARMTWFYRRTAALARARSASLASMTEPSRREAAPLAIAPRVAGVALVIQMALQRWEASSSALVSPLRAAGFIALAAIGIVVLVSMSTIALRLHRRWVIAGLLAWGLGWVASMADLGA